MKPDGIAVAGAVLALLAVVFFCMILAQTPFPVFKYASASDRFINVTQNVGPADSVFMWNSRTLDLMAQAFVIFAAAAGCLALLRTSDKEDNAGD